MVKQGNVPWNKGLTAKTDSRISHGKGSKKNSTQILRGTQTMEMKIIQDSGIWELECADCNKVMIYESWGGYRRSCRQIDRKCGSCKQRGKIVSENTKQKMSIAALNRNTTPKNEKIRRDKLSKSHKKVWANMTPDELKERGKLISIGQSNMTDEQKQSRDHNRSITRYNEMMKNGVIDKFRPSWNPAACQLIDEYGKSHNYDFRHAENHKNGEFFIFNEIKSRRFYADGYDAKRNIWIEIDEKHHYVHGVLREDDIQRQQEIINLLNCKFIRLSI